MRGRSLPLAATRERTGRERATQEGADADERHHNRALCWNLVVFAYTLVKLGLPVSMLGFTPPTALAARRLADVPGGKGVFVSLEWSPAWSARQMSSAAKAHLRFREDPE